MATKAQESSEIQKLRHKLEERLTKQESKTSPDALEIAREAIRQQIEHRGPRKKLKTRTFTQYDKQAHAEDVHSKFVKKLMTKLRTNQ